MFHPVGQERVSSEIVHQIERLILEGVLRPGDRLPAERDLAGEFGVSRPTLREALALLEASGLLTARQGGGTYVADVMHSIFGEPIIRLFGKHEKATGDYLEFREGIESITARYAALRATPEEIADLEVKLQKCNETTGDVKEYLTADFDFHYTIAKITKNDLLIQSMFVVKKYCYEALVKYVDKAISVDGTKRHKGILEAIKNHDPDAAEDHMNKHILKVIEMIDQ